MRAVLVFFLGAAVASAGCGTDDPPPDQPDAGPDAIEVIVGGADRDGLGYVELTDGQDVELRPGAQGGFHVWINLELRGMSGDLYVEREARRESDGQLVLAATRNLLVVPEEAETTFWHDDRGAAAFMCPAPVGIQIYDTRLRITARITNGERDDEKIVFGEGSVAVVPRCPADDLEFCQDICSGN